MSETMPGLIGRAFDQLCFVVEDLDAAIGYWRRVNGVERWSKAYDLAKDQIDKEYWGEPGDFQFSCAYAFAGDLLIELAQHDGGRSVYKDWLVTRGPSQPHIGFRLAESPVFAQAISAKPVEEVPLLTALSKEPKAALTVFLTCVTMS